MVKKKSGHPNGHCDKNILLLEFCKWEFMRRNKKYQKDFDKAKKNYGEDFLRWPEKINEYFQKKWNIYYPANYRETLSLKQVLNISNKYNYLKIPRFLTQNRLNISTRPIRIPNAIQTQITKQIRLKDSLPQFIGSPADCITPEVLTIWDDVYRGKTFFPKTANIPEEKLAEFTEINIKVNLLVHKAKILKEIDKIITKWQTRRNKYYKLSLMRQEDYKQYWKIYDIKQQYPNMTFRKIATKVCKNLTIDGVSRSDEDRISKAYKTCCKLIDGGYRKIGL